MEAKGTQRYTHMDVHESLAKKEREIHESNDPSATLSWLAGGANEDEQKK